MSFILFIRGINACIKTCVAQSIQFSSTKIRLQTVQVLHRAGKLQLCGLCDGEVLSNTDQSRCYTDRFEEGYIPERRSTLVHNTAQFSLRFQVLKVPKDSFIAIDDFPTIADLVRYVHEVADDKEKYLSYHRWRETYE